MGFIRKANSISDRPDLSFLTNMCLLVLRLSLIVLNNLFILQLPLWSRIWHSMWAINLSVQNSLNFVLRKIVAGFVYIGFGIPCLVLYLFRNSMTFSLGPLLNDLST